MWEMRSLGHIFLSFKVTRNILFRDVGAIKKTTLSKLISDKVLDDATQRSFILEPSATHIRFWRSPR